MYLWTGSNWSNLGTHLLLDHEDTNTGNFNSRIAAIQRPRPKFVYDGPEAEQCGQKISKNSVYFDVAKYSIFSVYAGQRNAVHDCSCFKCNSQLNKRDGTQSTE